MNKTGCESPPFEVEAIVRREWLTGCFEQSRKTVRTTEYIPIIENYKLITLVRWGTAVEVIEVEQKLCPCRPVIALPHRAWAPNIHFLVTRALGGIHRRIHWLFKKNHPFHSSASIRCRHLRVPNRTLSTTHYTIILNNSGSITSTPSRTAPEKTGHVWSHFCLIRQVDMTASKHLAPLIVWFVSLLMSVVFECWSCSLPAHSEWVPYWIWPSQLPSWGCLYQSWWQGPSHDYTDWQW